VDMLEQVGCVVPHVQNRLLVAGQECLYHLGFQVLSLHVLLVQKVQILIPEELRLQLQVLNLLALLVQNCKY
jgi:hypothetical protein